jgi:aminoglycoside phosphotransferase (APT) family kinase protein
MHDARHPADADTHPVRPTEELDWPRLGDYLRERLPALSIDGLDLSREMQVQQFAGGHSNLTYLLRFGDAELVLRRPPFGPVPRSAHDMAREYRWLSALSPIFAPAPRVYIFCDDHDVIGATFYVMERRRGVVVRDEEPPELLHRPEVRRQVSAVMVDGLADLHAIDITPPEIAQLGKPHGFVERQVRGWTDRWHGSKLTELPELDALAAWLAARLPPDPERSSVVHGDYKLNNLMLAAGGLDRMVGLFDWEMTALGDPLIDLGIMLAYWASPPDSPAAVTTRPGWFTREQILERYAARSGRDVSGIRFYEVFALFKIAVVVQQIYYRFVRGQTDDPRFARFGSRVEVLARQAMSMVEAG